MAPAQVMNRIRKRFGSNVILGSKMISMGSRLALELDIVQVSDLLVNLKREKSNKNIMLQAGLVLDKDLKLLIVSCIS